MDKEQEKRLEEMLDQIRTWSATEWDIRTFDPVAKMMLAAVLDETQKIRDAVDGFDRRIAERFCEDFIPARDVRAVPALAIIEPVFKRQIIAGPGIWICQGASFGYKTPASKQPIVYIPVFQSCLIPYNECCWLVSSCFRIGDSTRRTAGTREKPNVLWLGINTNYEMDSLQGVTLLFEGTGGVAPERISIGDTGQELSFSTMDRMEDIPMAEPFDSQQSSGRSFSFLREWKKYLLGMQDAALVYITDPVKDRDLFKPKSYPSVFQFYLMSEDLDAIKAGTLWLKVEFPEGFILPESSRVTVNAFPVVNVEVSQVNLTQSTPVAKLAREDAFFLDVLETSNQDRKQGFDLENDEYLIRDFDAVCYHNGDLYRDVRNLYHRFIEDYYAFVEYNGIKDGEQLRQLREIFKNISKSVGTQNARYKFDDGVYALKNINYVSQSKSTRVSYMTTRGKAGNGPTIGQLLECKRLPGVEKVHVIVSAACGRDKATADERYELIRYFNLTADRLYTRMDIDAFLRKEILQTFGKEEFSRISIRISVEGAGGSDSLCRGLYIDILFKDKTTYDRAAKDSFAQRMRQYIIYKSCLSMPVFVELINLEE